MLREVFDYPYEQIAGILRTGEDNARQLVSRARKHVDEGRPRFEASHEQRERLASSFLAAFSNGDLQALEELLADDVVAHGDGGGRVRAITRPVNGRAKVARMLVSGLRAAEALGGWSLSQVQVNGQPGAMVSDAAGKLIAVIVLDIADGHIQALRPRSPTRTSCATSTTRRREAARLPSPVRDRTTVRSASSAQASVEPGRPTAGLHEFRSTI